MAATATARDSDADFAGLAAVLAGGASLASLESLATTRWLYEEKFQEMFRGILGSVPNGANLEPVPSFACDCAAAG